MLVTSLVLQYFSSAYVLLERCYEEIRKEAQRITGSRLRDSHHSASIAMDENLMNKDSSWIDVILIRLYQSGVNDNAEEMYNHRSLHTDEAKAAIEAHIAQGNLVSEIRLLRDMNKADSLSLRDNGITELQQLVIDEMVDREAKLDDYGRRLLKESRQRAGITPQQDASKPTELSA